MRLSQKAIVAINESTECRRELSYQLEKATTTIWRWITANDENGPLTTVKAIEIISETTNLSQDEILETKTVKV